MGSTGVPYRREIDGLRALSVLAVVAFHFGSSRLTGGFVGVDVFFAISGYLITSQLLSALADGSFSVLTFYDRRLRRILPATLVVVCTSLLAGYWILLPTDYSDLGDSATWAAFGLVNFYFLAHSDYFSAAADMMALLHTWSLAVEEQFYLIWPPVLLAATSLARGSKVILAGTLISITAISFFASVLIVPYDQPQAFYMLHTRAWELAAGGLVALLPVVGGRLSAELMSATGLVLIAAAATILTSRSAFPGVNALLPVLGAALLLAPKVQQSLIDKLLSAQPLVLIGKISFSLYLWHWPVLVFYRHCAYGKMPAHGRLVALVAVSIALAALSYLLIEQPFRRLRPRRTTTVSAALASMATTAVIGFGIVSAQGLPSRYSEKALAFLTFKPAPMLPPEKVDCFVSSNSRRPFNLKECIEISRDRPNVLLIGDSHATHIAVALKKVFPEISFSQVSASGCLPVVPLSGAERCTNLMQEVFDHILSDYPFDELLISARWTGVPAEAVTRTINWLAPRIRHITVLGPNVEYKRRLPLLLAMSASSADGYQIIDKATERSVWTTSEEMQGSLRNTSADYVSVVDAICPNKVCATLDKSGNPMLFDANHYTVDAATEVLTALRQRGLLSSLLRTTSASN